MCMHMSKIPGRLCRIWNLRTRTVESQARRLHQGSGVNAPQQHASAAVHASESLRRERSQPALKLPPLDPEARAHAPLATLVGEVAAGLGAASGGALAEVVERCNAALEASLESQRGAAPGAEDPAALREELRGLARLLVAADRGDAPLVMRQIRRVLGRLDALGLV